MVHSEGGSGVFARSGGIVWELEMKVFRPIDAVVVCEWGGVEGG